MLRSVINKILQPSKNTNAYYCKALQGESSYNICINCDMTISCNCQDFLGDGHIGDLSKNTFEEIYYGKKAQSFRERLANGKLAIPLCARCAELQSVTKGEARLLLKKVKMPHLAIMVENTVLCNLQCRFCDRERIYNIRKKKRMSLDDMEKVAKLLHRHRIGAISFHNLGEPFASDTIHEELALLIRENPDLKIYLSTNGVLIDSTKKLESCLLLEHMYFSIDGPTQDILTRYQVGGNFEASFRNMKSVVELRNARGQKTPTVEWKYVVFAWNDDEEMIEAAIQLAKEAGVDLISFAQGGSPEEDCISRRYSEAVYFQTLGVASWRGREIWLNTP